MTLIDADVFLAYLIFSKHIDSLKCRDVKEAVEMSKVDVLNKIRAEIINLTNGDIPERIWNVDVLEILDKYKAEKEQEE